MMKFASDDDFMITHTYIADDAFGKRTEMFRIFGDTPQETLRTMGRRFKMYDDDGNLYFEGYAAEESFEPLDYATPRWGCTYICYLNTDNGEWEML